MKKFFLVPVVAFFVACGGGDPKSDVPLDALVDVPLDIAGDDGSMDVEETDDSLADLEDIDPDIWGDAADVSDPGDEGEDPINVEVIPLDPGTPDLGEEDDGTSDPDLGQDDPGMTDPGPEDPGPSDPGLDPDSDSSQVDLASETLPECLNAEDCNDENPCTNDVCINGECRRVNNASSCDDSNLCTEDDRCFEGECLGVPKTCDDGDPCTKDLCNVEEGCSNDPTPGCCAADSECNDDRNCTRDSCNMATNRCTNDECVEASAPSRCTLTPGVCVEASDMCYFDRFLDSLCPLDYPTCASISEWGGPSTCCRAAAGYPGGMCCLEEVPSQGLKKCLD